GEVIAKVPAGSRADASKAIMAAKKAAAWYRTTSVFERSEILLKVAHAVHEAQDELAKTISLEQGKPYFSEAIGEASAAMSQYEEAAEQCKWLLNGEMVPTRDKNKIAYTTLTPKGVFGIITPWNYPVNIPSEYLAAALATGNTVVWNPASSTTLCAIKLMECIDRAGVPAGVINLVSGRGSIVGDEISQNDDVNGIGFTGSTVVGKIIASKAQAKALILEMGGNGPSIILDDANLDLAIAPIASASFNNAGQICCATERVLVHRSRYKEVCDRMVAAAEAYVLGDPLKESTTMGSMNNRETFQKNIEHAEDGKKRGVKFLVGGKPAKEFSKGFYFEPTVVCDVPLDSLYNLDETFGPCAPIIPFDTDEQALSMANSDQWGLVKSVFTGSIPRSTYFADRLESGVVVINDGNCYLEYHLPFGGGGSKMSGVGRLGGKYAMQCMCDIKTICVDKR
ncbi:MAG: aldehyde dehydrogenase family protein, partial [Clostridia bacterium]